MDNYFATYDSEDENVDRHNKRIALNRSKMYLNGMNINFSKEMHQKWDIPARKVILEKLGDFVKENPEETMQDFIINDKEFIFDYLEVQVKVNWDCPSYPDKVFRLHPRKLRYGNNTLFITFNNTMSEGYVFNFIGLDLTPHRIKKYSRKWVVDIPWNRLIKFRTSELSPRLLKSFFNL